MNFDFLPTITICYIAAVVASVIAKVISEVGVRRFKYKVFRKYSSLPLKFIPQKNNSKLAIFPDLMATKPAEMKESDWLRLEYQALILASIIDIRTVESKISQEINKYRNSKSQASSLAKLFEFSATLDKDKSYANRELFYLYSSTDYKDFGNFILDGIEKKYIKNNEQKLATIMKELSNSPERRKSVSSA